MVQELFTKVLSPALCSGHSTFSKQIPQALALPACHWGGQPRNLHLELHGFVKRMLSIYKHKYHLGKQLCKTYTREIYKNHVLTVGGGGEEWDQQDGSLNLTAPWQGRPHGEPGPKIDKPHLPWFLFVQRVRCRSALHPESLPLHTKQRVTRALGDHLRL